MDDFNPELEQEAYIPRPRWQVWGARIALAGVKIRAGGRGDGTAAQEGELPPLALDQAEARGAVAGVDPKNPHIRRDWRWTSNRAPRR